MPLDDIPPGTQPRCPHCDEPRPQLSFFTRDWDARVFECPETGYRFSVRDALKYGFEFQTMDNTERHLDAMFSDMEGTSE